MQKCCSILLMSVHERAVQKSTRRHPAGRASVSAGSPNQYGILCSRYASHKMTGKRFKQFDSKLLFNLSMAKSKKNLLALFTGQKAGLYGLVIIARWAPPVPIPNTTVKPLSADGTMS